MKKSLNFHGLDVPPSSREDALFHIMPVPMEKSVSYGSGTSLGPASIIKASEQLELFDGKSVPAECGIFTGEEINCSVPVEGIFQRIKFAVKTSLSAQGIPVILGGEHTVSFPAVQAIAEQHESFGVIQFDAHADLRDSYEGTGFSHACVMRRICELDIPIIQIGTRSYSLDEHQFRQQKKILYFDAEALQNGVDFQIPESFPDKIYLTFDIDAMDSAVFPATGTPVPGGLSWYQAMAIIERCLAQRVCLGFDVVEFAPIKNLHGCSFAAAQLVYNIMGIIQRSSVNRQYWQITD